MPRITADVLIGDSQGFSLDYYRFNRDYGTGFANSFAIGPTSVTALGNVNVDLKLDFAKFAYKWWIGRAQAGLRCAEQHGAAAGQVEGPSPRGRGNKAGTSVPARDARAFFAQAGLAPSPSGRGRG